MAASVKLYLAKVEQMQKCNQAAKLNFDEIKKTARKGQYIGRRNMGKTARSTQKRAAFLERAHTGRSGIVTFKRRQILVAVAESLSKEKVLSKRSILLECIC